MANYPRSREPSKMTTTLRINPRVVELVSALAKLEGRHMSALWEAAMYRYFEGQLPALDGDTDPLTADLKLLLAEAVSEGPHAVEREALQVWVAAELQKRGVT